MENESKDTKDEAKEEETEYYDWTMIPHCGREENKNGVTFKGDSQEYLEARDKIFDLFNKKGRKLTINNRKLRVVDNAENKPFKQFKIEVTPPKGLSGKVNMKIYGANKAGIATFMITKTKDSQLIHVKTLAFRVIRYLLDGIIDGVIKGDDFDDYIEVSKSGGDGSNTEGTSRCDQCDETFKTKNGISIHMEKVHRNHHQNRCVFCGNIFDTEEDIRLHIKMEHRENQDFRCEKCNFTFQEDGSLKEHIQRCGEKKENQGKCSFHSKCDYCDLKLWAENDVQAKENLSSHLLVCSFYPKNTTDVPLHHYCKKCNFSTQIEKELKRHKRDEHDDSSMSTSPKPKRRKQLEDVESMDVEEPIDDQNKMDIDEILIERSKSWDEKIKKKNEKNEAEEKRLKKEKEEKQKQEFQKREKEKKEAEKLKKMKSKLKKSNERVQIKSFLREIPQSVKNLIGEDYYLYPVVGDGACGLRAIAGWIFQDPTEGPYLGRNVNAHFVRNWHYWKNFFSFPFVREIGNKGVIRIENERDLLKFLENGEEGAFMWRDHEDFAAISNIFQVRIKIITVRNTEDLHPTISIQDPDPNFKAETESTPGQIPEIILFHLKDMHYDLIVPKDCRMAEEGGLDLQRKQKSNIKDLKDGEEGKNVEEIKENASLLKKIDELERKLKLMENKVHELEKEMVKGPEIKYLCSKCDDIKCRKCEIEITSKSNQEEHMRNKVSNQNKCEKCGTFFWTESLLENHIKEDHKDEIKNCKYCNSGFKTEECLTKHMEEKHKEEIHEEQKKRGFKRSNQSDQCEENVLINGNMGALKKTHMPAKRFPCRKCNQIFSNKTDLNDHLEIHKTSKQKFKTRQYNCDDCAFQGENFPELKRHVDRSGHRPTKYRETCFTCEEEFDGYYELMTHRKSKHPSARTCRYFKRDECIFSSEVCWYRHDETLEVEQEKKFSKLTCQYCSETFEGKKDLKMHMKRKHRELVAKCTDFENGKCQLKEYWCWFIHEDQAKECTNNIEKNSENDSFKAETNNQVFRETTEKIPPDQTSQILKMLTELSLQVKNIENRTKNCS